MAPRPARSGFSRACLWVAISGGVSMGLEVLASRSLALLFGSSLQAFATVLMAFILGISLGSLFIATRVARRWSQETTTLALLLGAAGVVGLLIWTIESWVDFYRIAQSGLARSQTGYYYHLG